MKVGFLVNPIAGIGGRVGLKGSDNVEDEAVKRGGKSVSPARAKEAISGLVTHLGSSLKKLDFVTCSGAMGEKELRGAGVAKNQIEVVCETPSHSSAKDTERASAKFLEMKVDLVLFCGGDGTARDIVRIIDNKIPVIGIPAGVKMHSGVFCVRPEALAALLREHLEGRVDTGDAEILDLDEEEYRRGNWSVRLFATAKTLLEPTLVQTGKMMVEEVADDAVKLEMIEHIKELMMMEPECLFLLGPGSTIAFIAQGLGFDKTLLGIDAAAGGKMIGKNLDEKGILSLLKRFRVSKLVVSPIGAQGFILGRGNLEVSPEVVRKIGITNIMVLATPSKLRVTPTLRVDTGDADLDSEFARRAYLPVVVGYRMMKMHPLQV